MEGRVVPSCCPGVPALLLSTALAASSGRFLHSSFSVPEENVVINNDQQEILLRNNSEHAVHIPSDREGPGPSNVDSRRGQEERPRTPRLRCDCGNKIPGAAALGKFGRQALDRMVCDPLLLRRILVMIVLALIITALTVLAWYFSSELASKSVNSVARALRSDLLSRTAVTASTLLHNANVSSTALATLFSSSLIPGNYSVFSTLEEQVRPVLFSAYSVIPQKILVSYFGKNGLFISYTSEGGGTSVLFANSTYLHDDGASNSSGGGVVDVPWKDGEDISATRPWYKWYQQSADTSTGLPSGVVTELLPTPYWAMEIFNGTWSFGQGESWGVLSSHGDDLYILSVSLVTQGGVSDSVGVAGVGFSISEIGRSLESIDLDGGEAYITTLDGRLLVETNTDVNFEVASSGMPILPLATDSDNSVVAGAARYLSSISGQNATQPFAANHVEIGGKSYVINSAPIVVSRTTLVCVIVIPRDSLWGTSNKRSRTVLALLLALTACLGLLGCLFVILLTKGVTSEMRLRGALIRQLEATNQAENKSSTKSIIFASMSHDLRTPLAAILGLIDLCLYDAAESSELESNLTQMKSCATNLLDILNSILDMSKIEAGKLQLEASEFDLMELLEEAVEMFAVVGMMKGLDVVLDLPDDSIEMAPKVMGDPGRVKQVLSNLLSNGVKFTSSGYVVLRAWRKPSIEADVGLRESKRKRFFRWFSSWMPWASRDQAGRPSSTRQLESGDSFANLDVVEFEFEVDDTGKGIPRSRRRAVFENFVQVDNSVPRTHGGTGLGLGIVRSLVRLMGGDISILDKDEPGARFRFNILLQVHRNPTIQLEGEFGAQNETSSTINASQSVSARHAEAGSSIGGREVPTSSDTPEIGRHFGRTPYSRSPHHVEGVHVLLAMQGQAGRKAARRWMERHGLHVWSVRHHEDIPTALEKIKFDVFYEESFSWSECFEVSPAFQGHGPGARSELPLPQSEIELHAEISNRRKKKAVAEKVIPRLLLVIDVALVSNILDNLIANLHNNLMQGDLVSLTKVVWLVTPNTPSSVVQKLKQGRLPCDLMLHKPLNISRLRVIWEQVMILIKSREIANTESRPSTSFTISPLGDLRLGSGPPPSPTHERAAPVDTPEPDSRIEDGQNGTAGGDERAVGQGGRNGSSTRLQRVDDNDMSTETSGALEVQPLVQSWSSPSPEVGPFPRVRPREADVIGPPNSLKGMHILVAEDNPVLQRLTKTMLVRLGASVECVDQGEQAVQLVLANLPRKGPSRSSSFGSLRRNRSSREQSDEETPPQKKRPFDMVLMDCQMPILDGYQATQRIREHERLVGWRTPVIALTAAAMAKDESKCIEAGMDFYLTKPLATKALLNVVAKMNPSTERQG